MTQQEFTTRTGFIPTPEHFEIICNAYYETPDDKDIFCKDYLDNKDGIATKTALLTHENIANREKSAQKKIEDLEKKISDLTEKLDRELEWVPYELKENVPQKEYDHLRNESSTKILTKEDAINLINEEFGFEKKSIQIIYEVSIYEKNRHSQLRKIGKRERLPLYNATDWNYIRFNCKNWYYEMHNGSLQPFFD